MFSIVSNDIKRHSGGYSVGVPPLPIPNREVKPDRADGTAFVGEQVAAVFRREELSNEDDSSLCLYMWLGSMNMLQILVEILESYMYTCKSDYILPDSGIRVRSLAGILPMFVKLMKKKYLYGAV